MAKLVRRKVAEEKQDSGKKVAKLFEFRHNFAFTLRDNHRTVTWEQMQERIKELLLEEFPGSLVTPVGGYLMIDGRACYPHDFDYETMDRKPGTHPPSYTLTKEEQEHVKALERIDRESRNPNHLARNPVNLLTAPETDRLNEFRKKNGSADPKPAVKKLARKPVPVEWTEQDADDEGLVERETRKLVRSVSSKPAPKKLVRKKP